MVDSRLAVLLNPCSCNASVNFVKESWLTTGSGPLMQVQADSDCLYLDVGPKHVLAVKDILSDASEIMARLKRDDEAMEVDEDDVIGITTHEQHYKDDLKSGAFQFVDGNPDELPFPYQVSLSTLCEYAYYFFILNFNYVIAGGILVESTTSNGLAISTSTSTHKNPRQSSSYRGKHF